MRTLPFPSIDQFTVVCLVTWPLDGGEARDDLVLIQTSLLLLCKTSCSDGNKVHLHDKSREVCIKTSSTLASLPSTGQVAEQTTVKWSIHNVCLLISVSQISTAVIFPVIHLLVFFHPPPQSTLEPPFFSSNLEIYILLT